MKKQILLILIFLISGNLVFSQAKGKKIKIDTTLTEIKSSNDSDSSIVIIQLGKEEKKEDNSFFEKYLPLILSILASMISVFTLYYTQLRRGKLKIGLPNRFLITTTNRHPTFEITISLVNSGILPVIVNHINLISKRGQKIIFKIPISEFTVDELEMKNGSLEVAHKKNRELSKPIILNGSEKSVLTLSFNEGELFYTFEQGDYEFELELLLNNKVNKRKKVGFKVEIDKDVINTFYSEESIKEQVEKNRFNGIYFLINKIGNEIILPKEKKNTEQNNV